VDFNAAIQGWIVKLEQSQKQIEISETLKQDCNTIQTDYRKAISELEKLRMEIEREVGKIQNKDMKIKELHQVIEQLSIRISIPQQQLSEVFSRIRRIETHVKQVETFDEPRVDEREYSEAVKNYPSTIKEISSLQEELSLLSVKIAEVTGGNWQLEKLVLALEKKVATTRTAVAKREADLRNARDRHQLDLANLNKQIIKYRELVKNFKDLILRVSPFPPIAPQLPDLIQIKRIETRDRYYVGLIELKMVSEQELSILNKGIGEITIAGWKLVSHRQNHHLVLPPKLSIPPFGRVAVVLVPDPKLEFIVHDEHIRTVEWDLDAWVAEDFALILFDSDGLLVADLHHLCGNTVSGTSHETSFNTFLDPNDMQ